MRFIAVKFFCIFCIILIGLNFTITAHAQSSRKSTKIQYLSKINSLDEFESLQNKPLTDKFSNIHSVKVVYSIANGKVYFINCNWFTYHYEFCTEVLGCKDELFVFNDKNYSKTSQDFLLGNINYIPNSSIFFLELAASDQMQAKEVIILYKKISEKVYFKADFTFFLNSPNLLQSEKQLSKNIKCVKGGFIFENIKEQSIKNGFAVGYLKKYDLSTNRILNSAKDEIIVVNEIPDFIPEVKGIILTKNVTPLSHFALLIRNRNIPVYVLKDAWTNKTINNLIDKKVELRVDEIGFKMKETTKIIPINSTTKKILLKKDLSVATLVNLNKNVPTSGYKYIGSKAQNLAYLHQIANETRWFKTPEYLYAIPFYFYEEHIVKNEITPFIDSLLKIEKDSVELIKDQLKTIRKRIKNGVLNISLVRSIDSVLRQQVAFSNFKFRSSTNAEDIEGFNGAGLYVSKAVKIGDSIKTIKKAILSVWESLWSDNAFFERELFKIDHRTCAMAILFHRSFTDEDANGVLITKNLYRNYSGITINIQKGEEAVVHENGNIACDELSVHNFNGMDMHPSIDYKFLSTINDGKPLLTEKQIKYLFEMTMKLEMKMNSIWRKNKQTSNYRPLDIEFKYLDNFSTLYFKQVRAYMD